MQKVQGFVQAGNTTLTITGAAGTISRKVQGSFPGATITVYKSGTVTLATIYADDSLTPKANPFTSAADGTWFFYAPDGGYDVKFSGGGIAAPFTLGDFLFFDESAIWANVCDVAYGADNTGTNDSSAAFTSALNAADIVLVPNGTYRWNSTVTGMTTGKAMICQSSLANRWRGSSPVYIDYRGTTAALSVVTTAGVNISSIYMRGIQIDGTNVNGNVDGILLEADAGGGDSVEGIVIEGCTITNFPRNQVRSLRTVYDVTWRDCSFNNAARAADDLVRIKYDGTAGAASQWTFDNCFAVQYTAGKYCYNGGKDTALSTDAIGELRLIGGTVAQAAGGAGSHGVKVYGGLVIDATHFEGNDASQTTNHAILYTGSSGAYICPSNLSLYGKGILIGDPNNKTIEALGCIVTGIVGFNNIAAGGVDCEIVDGGSRAGTGISVMGYFTTNPFVLSNLRESIDSNTTDLRYCFTNDNTKTQLSGPIGIGMTPDLWLSILHANNNGIRGRNSSNGNKILYQLLSSGNVGELSLYDSSEAERVVVSGSGVAGLSTIGAVSVDGSSILSLFSTTLGFLPPKMSTTNRNLISAGSPTKGILVYDSTLDRWYGYNGNWLAMLEGVSGTTGSIASGATVTHGLGTTPSQVFVTAQESVNGIYVTAIGATTFTLNYTGGGTHVFSWMAVK